MNKYCIHQNYTLKETIERIDAGQDRVAIVLNDADKVIGVVSQGDIIRALCAGKNIFARVDSIIRTSFLYLTNCDYEDAYKLFKKKKITLLPIIDSNYSLKSVITLEDIFNYLEEKNS